MAKPDDRIRFVDTNVLLAATDASRREHDRSLALLDRAMAGELSLYASGQVFREYLVVATRPVEANGLGLDSTEALANVEEFSRCVGLLEETAEVSRELRKLLGRHALRGKRLHDANIVATMLAHGVKRLATDNNADFETFPEIRIDGFQES